jgi:hypothetical protein
VESHFRGNGGEQERFWGLFFSSSTSTPSNNKEAEKREKEGE